MSANDLFGGRLLGIDFGAKRVGLALSDPSLTIASPLRTISYTGTEELLQELAVAIEEHHVVKIVVGYPVGMSGERTSQTKQAEEFVEVLRTHFDLPTERMDERLSSVEASRALLHQGYRASRNRAMVDDTAAAIILQTYLDTLSAS